MDSEFSAETKRGLWKICDHSGAQEARETVRVWMEMWAKSFPEDNTADMEAEALEMISEWERLQQQQQQQL